MLTSIWAWLTAPEQWTGSGAIPTRIGEHLLYCALAMALAAVLALPAGLWVGHTGRGRWLVTLANAARAVPSLGLLFAVAMIVQPRISSTLAFVIPSLVVLVLLAVPPLLSGAYAGVAAVDPAARDAAYGMGMAGPRVLRDVELPCALPLLLSGVRSASLQLVGTATIAASVSLGGLGRYLIDGLAAQDYPQMAGGALLVALLALALDLVLAMLSRYAVSPGLGGKHPGARAVARPDGRVPAPGASSTVALPDTGSLPRTVSPTDGNELR